MKTTLIILGFLISCGASAQFNDSTHHYINYNGSGTINKTNDAKSYILNNLLKFSISKRTMSLNTNNSYIYGQSNGEKTNRDFSSAVDFNYWRPNQKIYYWGLGTFDKSLSLQINHRFQAGLGIGYSVLTTKNASIGLSDGFLYEKGDVTSSGERQPYHTFRNSFRLKYHWGNDIVTLDGVGFYQPSIEHFDDYVIKYNTTLGVKLKKWLTITSTLTYNKISATSRENLLITFGVVVERYF